MELYTNKDLEKFEKEKSNIEQKHKIAKLKYIEPVKSEREDINKVIHSFIIKNHRKVYGGYALNLLIKNKNKNDAIYKETDMPDIEFYSYEPINDLIRICNELYNKKFKRVTGMEAEHLETYTVMVNTEKYCDITYMPKQLYNILSTRVIEGYTVVHPHFLEIDYLRQINDPLVSYWRLDKFSRFYLLQKYYPLPHVGEFLPEIQIKNPDIINDIKNWLKNKITTIIIGQYAFNYFLIKSKIDKTNFKIIPVPNYEFISIDFRNDAIDLLKYLQEKYENITMTEHYPFFQFLGHSAYVYHNDDLVCIIYDRNNRCIPYLTIPLYNFTKEGFSEEKENIQIGTFSVTLMYSLIKLTKAKMDKDDLIYKYYTVMSSQLVEMRRYYLNKNKLTILDNTVFKDFQIECIGDEITPKMEKTHKIEKRKEKGKMLRFSYYPDENLKEPNSDYKFSNTSGNPIKDAKKFKIK